MVSSMTAYAREERQTALGALTVEIRSLNYRYLDVHMNLPENWDAFIPNGVQIIKNALVRGRAECRILFSPCRESATFEVDTRLITQLTKALETMADTYPHAQGVNVWDLLSWPGVMTKKSIVIEDVANDVYDLIQSVAEAVVCARQREGAALAEVIHDRLSAISSHIGFIKRRLPWVIRRHREKLLSKLSGIKNSLDPVRLEQEMVLFANKMDVSEELERLDVHVKEVAHVLAEGGAVGRRLDFMMQELNREANTLASKSIDAKISHAAVQLKVLIEQMREQVQNIE